jgi:hypothetical protein
MALPSKQGIEVFFVNSFLKHMGKETSWVFPGSDPPDVLARFGKKSVGIEVTQHIGDSAPSKRGGSARAVELAELRELEKWLLMGRCRYSDLDGVNVWLYFRGHEATPNQRELPSRAEQPRFTRQLHDFVRKRLPALKLSRNEKSDFREFDHRYYNLLGVYLDRIQIELVNCFVTWTPFCNISEGDWSDPVPPGILAEIMRKKAMRLFRLGKDKEKSWVFHEVWLLVVTGDMYAPTLPRKSLDVLNTNPDLKCALEELPPLCTRVYLYDYQLGEVVWWRRGKAWNTKKRSEMAEPFRTLESR